jgi:DNA-binding transcriptional MerR regulator
MPQVVEGKAEQGEGAAGGDQDASDRGVPGRGKADRGRPGPGSTGQCDGEPPGDEDADQPEQDRVVGRVGQRSVVTPLVDVQGDVPVHAEERQDQRHGGECGGEGGPAREPGHPLAERCGLAEHRVAAGAVAPHEQREPAEHGADQRRGQDHLPDRRAAGGGVSLSEQEQLHGLCYTEWCHTKHCKTGYVTEIAHELEGDRLTVDELARRTGMTVRNIRAHQSRGLLAPPEVRGRTGYYGPEHVARIELIRELQADGFKLESIRRLLEGAGGSSEEVLRFTRALRAPFEDEQPQIVTGEELVERWGAADPAVMRRAEKLGFIRPLGGDRYEELSPRLARASAELAALGVPPRAALDVATRLQRHAQGVARTFVELFLEQVWKPFEEAGRPRERWPEVREALERLRPLAAESLLAVFQLTMSEAVENAFGRQLERMRRGSKS